jgi:excisionase family DNA binding protein
VCMEVGVVEAAQRLGVSGERVRQLIHDEKLPARRVSGRFLIDESALDRPPARSRAMSVSMAWWLIGMLSGDVRPSDARPTEVTRLREKLSRLRADDEPAKLLRSWLASRAERRAYSVAPADLPELRNDARLVVSGISDGRAGLSSAAELEGYVDPAELDALVLEYLLSEVGRPNVFLHLHALDGPQAPLGVVLADLADHNSPREDGRLADLLHEVLA